MVFNVFGSRDLPRDPQETQEPTKKHPKSFKRPQKINQKKSKRDLSGKKCLKLAISKKAIPGTHLRNQNCTSFKQFLHNLLKTF